ncbi:MAG: hypothetical protein F6K03_10210, partial [Kamptonema sp. SIO4C4]|nr:hypothetical protein [Kamptonema sp. SIO4C4]
KSRYLTTTIQTGNRLELSLPELSVGQKVEVIVIVPDAEDSTGENKNRDLMQLSLAERRHLLAEQAEVMVQHYEQDTDWQEWVNADLGENDDYDS